MKTLPSKLMVLWLHALLLTGLVRSSAQIGVGPGGSGVLTFNSQPTMAQGWSTLAMGNTGANAYFTATNLDAALQNVAAGSINQALGSSFSVPPTANGLARWNSSLLRIQTRPAVNDCTLLMATLRNNVGNLVGSIIVSYAFAVEPGNVPIEEIPAHRVFYSLTGLTGSWQFIPEFSGVSTSGVVTAALNVEWPTNSLLYLLWADDNALDTDGAYTLDNFSVSAAIFTNIFITNQPQNVVVPQGSPAMFQVSARGESLRYQWLKDGGAILEATNPVFIIEATVPSDLGTYSVVVSNTFTSVLSSNATLTFGTNPVAIISQPTDAVVNAGQPAAFSVQASGSLPRLQWFRNGNALAGATNLTLLIPAASEADAAVYFAVVSNPLNSITSSNAFLHVRTPVVTLLTSTNHWRYDASGTDLGTAWKETNFDDSSWSNGLAVLGFDTSPGVASLINTVLPLTNLSGSIISYYFRARFNITNNLEGVTLLASNYLDDGAVYYLNGVEFHRQAMPAGIINHRTLATTTSGGFSEGTFFTMPVPPSLVVTGENVMAVEVHQVNASSTDIAFGMALQMTAAEVGPAAIRTPPSGQLKLVGDAVSFEAVVAGTPPLALQWFHDDVAIPSATNQILILTNVTAEDTGFYRLKVSNQINVAISLPAQLRLVAATGQPATLLQFTDTWRYQSGTNDLGVNWRQPGYSDASWPSGAGIFASQTGGFPETVRTVVSRRTPAFDAITTDYFRTHFFKPGTNSEALLIFSNLLDDGAVFYLNGTELFRTRMPSGSVSYGTLASSAPANGTQYEMVQVPIVSLLPGTNVLAVEVHQSAPTSFDAVFGTRLAIIAGRGEGATIVAEPPDVTVPSGYPASLRAEAFGTAPMSLQWFKDGLPLAGATNNALHFPLTTTNDAGSYVLRASNVFNVAFSSAGMLTIGAETNPPVVLRRGPYLQNGTTNSVVLRWRTSAPAQSRVHFGTNQNDLNLLAFDPVLRTNHILPLTNLAPDTRYYYSAWTGFSNLASGADFTFLTPPVSAKPTRIWVQGDSGTATVAARAVVDAFINFNGRAPDVWLMLGDNAYFAGTDGEYQTAMFDFMPDILRQTLLWTTIGNHETYSTSLPGPFPYLDIFSPPTMGEAGGVPSGTKYYYSFDYGNIHFVSLDSEESDRSPTGAMATWLQEDLAANTKDWLIAFWHSPPYTKGSHNSDSVGDSGGRMVQMRENILPILESYGVDLVLGGHSHCYERSFLLDGHYGYSHTLQPLMLKDSGSGRENDTGSYRKTSVGPAPREGTVYVVAGSSGQATFGTLDHPIMQVSVLEMGSLVIDVNNNRLDALFLRDTGEVRDHFSIIKGGPAEPLRVATFRLADEKVYGTWKSVAGRIYQVEASSAVTGAPWVPVGNPAPATGATSFWTNDVVTGAAVFYQVRDVSP